MRSHLLFSILALILCGGTSAKEWDIYEWSGKAFARIENAGMLADLKPAAKMRRGARYLLACEIWADEHQRAALVPASCTVEHVQIGGTTIGLNRDSGYTIAVDVRHALLLVVLHCSTDDAALDIQASGKIYQRRWRAADPLRFECAIRPLAPGIARIAGTVNYRARVFVGDIFYGEMLDTWFSTIHLPESDSGTLRVRAESFYGTVEKPATLKRVPDAGGDDSLPENSGVVAMLRKARSWDRKNAPCTWRQQSTSACRRRGERL